MQLLMITWNYPSKLGGMEVMIAQIVAGLRRHMRVRVLGPYDPLERDEPDTVRAGRGGLAWFILSAIFTGWRLLRREPIDLLIGGSALMTPVLFVLSRLGIRPFMVIVHGLDLVYEHPLYQFMLRRLLPRADYVIANSENTQRLAEQLGVSRVNIQVIPPGVALPQTIPAKRIGQFCAERQLTQRKIILSVGRLAARKGIVEFVTAAMPGIVSEVPEVLFLIAGENPTDSLAHKADVKEAVKTAVAKQGLEQYVRLLGRVDDETLRALYQCCDLFILPALDVPGDIEGFGIVLAEAAAASKPVVATRVGGITDAVADGETGKLVACGDWDGLKTAVVDLLADEAKQQQMGDNARRRVEEKFEWAIVIRQYQALLAAVSNRDRRKRMSKEQSRQHSEQDLIKQFYDSVYYRAANRKLKYMPHFRRLARKIGLRRGQTLLDVACGRGEWLLVAREKGVHPYGLDLSEKAVEICQTMMPDGKFHTGPAESLPFDDAQFDLVSCLGSLEHFLKPELALAEMRRVAKPGASFLFAVPNAGFLTRRLGLFGGTDQTDAYEKVRFMAEWEALFARAGLHVERKWADLHVLSTDWILAGRWFTLPLRLVQALSLLVWPLHWQYQIYFQCRAD